MCIHIEDRSLWSPLKTYGRVCIESDFRETFGWVSSLGCDDHPSIWWPCMIRLNLAFKSECCLSALSSVLTKLVINLLDQTLAETKSQMAWVTWERCNFFKFIFLDRFWQKCFKTCWPTRMTTCELCEDCCEKRCATPARTLTLPFSVGAWPKRGRKPSSLTLSQRWRFVFVYSHQFVYWCVF